jgi:hypothetical protein
MNEQIIVPFKSQRDENSNEGSPQEMEHQNKPAKTYGRLVLRWSASTYLQFTKPNIHIVNYADSCVHIHSDLSTIRISNDEVMKERIISKFELVSYLEDTQLEI